MTRAWARGQPKRSGTGGSRSAALTSRCGAGMVRFHPRRTLFLGWPPYKLPMASRCLANYAGRTVIFVGELGGCTGDDAFYEAVDRDWRIEKVVAIPQWIGLHDRMFVLTRKEME